MSANSAEEPVDARVRRRLRELRMGGGVEGVGRGPLLGEEAADGVGGPVALAAGVEQQHVAAGAAEHERAVQAGDATAEYEAIT